MVPCSFTTAFKAVGIGHLLAVNGAVATPGFKGSASPSYNSIDVCPERCSASGAEHRKVISASRVASGKSVDVEFEVGWWEDGFGLAVSGLRSLIKQVRQYVEKSDEATDRPFIIYGKSGQATIGLYIGQGLLNQGLSQSALKLFQDNIDNITFSNPSLAMQLCEENCDKTHIFGIILTSERKQQ
ncbi:hypothetical protein PENANT_c094G11539 [Penicillium antarcticum]|uniref:Uncharacterized protein n=1 Tax=Penicillium antarcticum TaxID=416450 RepID=A0A1V6PM94_9EURO|nr:hypothetical protein PENANT_c094G11539 [Penicillium antarcticum]